MDMTAVLSALASVAASLIGFASLLTAFRAANDTLTPYDANNVRSLLICAVSALVFALLPLPFTGSSMATGAWKLLTILLGANLLFWAVQSPRWMKRTGLKPRNRALYLGMLIAQGALASALIVSTLFVQRTHVLYAVGVLWFLIAALVVFVVQIFLLLPVSEARRDGQAEPTPGAKS